MIFVTGEPGIGKTTLVDGLLQQTPASAGAWIARGQCLEQYGAGEAYLPVLEGLSRLCRAPDGGRIVDLLRQHAPAWLLELPSVVLPAEREALRQQVAGGTRERMLREMADAIDAIAAVKPLVVVLEDLQWSDYSTVDLVAYIARRRDPARLLIIGTYRPVEMILGDHRLKAVKRELLAHGAAREIPLGYLTEDSVAEYLEIRFPGHHLPKRLARSIHRRSEGNPLFMINIVDYLVAEQVIALDGGGWQLRGELEDIESGIPESVRQLIEKQIEHLSADERRVLEGASVVGLECSTVAIGAGLGAPTEWVEEHCEALVRRHQFLQPGRLVELPDGTITPRYKFSHVLYLEVPYRLLPPMRRSQIHHRVGHSGEAIYRDHVGEIAAELAMHFEQAVDLPRAVKYLLMAASTAAQRSAHYEADVLARRGLQALRKLPATAERDRVELELRLILGGAVMAIKGFAAAEAKEVYEAALELCERQGTPAHAFRIRWLLGLYYYFRAELPRAEEKARQLLTVAEELAETFFVFEAHRAYGSMLLDQGRFVAALEHLEHAAAVHSKAGHTPSFAGQTPVLINECLRARAAWALGFPDTALERVERAIALAQNASHPERLLTASHFAAQVHQLRGDAAMTAERAETLTALAEEYGLPFWIASGRVHRGWALVARGDVAGGVAALQRGLEMYDATGARLWRPHYGGLVARALAAAGRIDAALSEVAGALAMVESSGEYWCAAELHRIQGELLIAQAVGRVDESAAPPGVPAPAATLAEACFQRALTLSRAQAARSWDLRASTSLGLFLDYAQNRRPEAQRVLRDVLAWFTEGHETEDQKRARSLLNAWQPPSRTQR